MTKAGIARLAHVIAALKSDDIDNALNHLRNGTGSPPGSALSLASFAEGKAIVAWFQDGALDDFKKWAYTVAMFQKLRMLMPGEIEDLRRSPGGVTLMFLYPLLSDNESVIQWFLSQDELYDPKIIERVKSHAFWAYQTILALRGEWDRLLERSERLLKDPPGANSQRAYLADYQFFIALANGDIKAMEAALSEITSAKNMRSRKIAEGGYTEDLISTPAVIYAKIAWRHGYPVKVDTPHIPPEWLPVKPLAQYVPLFDVLRHV